MQAGLNTSRIEVDLNPLDWVMTNSVGTHKLHTKLPAYVLEVLHRNGVVDDPLYRYGWKELGGQESILS